MRVFLCLMFLILPWQRVYGGEKTAYWGVVSPGGGSGVLGHGFLLVKESNEPFLAASVYQYNFLDSNEGWTFGLSVQKFYAILSGYSFGENRSVDLFKLNLRPLEIDKLLALLKTDLDDPLFELEHPYGLENNCVTRPIELINKVVDADRRIPLLDHSFSFKNFTSDILDALPFFIAKTLENHPISSGRVKHYDRKSVYQARFFSVVLSDGHALASLCHWRPETEKVLDFCYLDFLKTNSTADLTAITNFVRSCPGSKDHLLHSLAALYQSADLDSKSRDEIYTAISGLLK